MTWEILVVLLLLAAATVSYMLELASVDLITLMLLVGLVLTGVLGPEEAFSGFANEIIIVLCSIFVLSGALARTGVMDRLAVWIAKNSGSSELRALAILTAVSTVTSAFLSNTTTTAVLIPTVMALCRKTGLSPGRLLMPVAFASLLGGTCTLIGTSTNLAASGMVAKLGQAPFSMFEFTALGSLIAVLGLGYLLLAAGRLLPDTRTTGEIEDFGLLHYMTELQVGEDCPWAGRSMSELELSDSGINVAQIIRAGKRMRAYSNSRIRAGDKLIVTAEPADVVRMQEIPGLSVLSDGAAPDLDDAEIRVLEAVIPPDSIFADRTLKQLDLRRRHRVSVLAVYQRGGRLAAHVRNVRMRVGDVLLLQGRLASLEPFLSARELLLLGEPAPVSFQRRRGIYALAALAVAVALSGTAWLPVSTAFLLAAVAVVLMRCVPVEEIYSLIEWRLVVLIGGMTSFGLAMQKSGAGVFLAEGIAAAVGPWGTYPLLAAFGALTMLLTQPMSNAAAALVVLPVALPAASAAGVEPRVLAVVVTLSASLSFVAPLEPASLLVYGPGQYRFRDFLKTGLPLSLLTLALLVWIVPELWG